MKYPYHVFLSHAVEDKIGIANELYEALTAKGLTVWYSGRELNVGDSIIDRIHEGLDQCRYGIIIISPTYLDKVWGIYEFAALITAKSKGDKIILPVLYNLTAQELAERAPMLVDTFCLQADKGIPIIAEALHGEITKTNGSSGIDWARWKKQVYRLLIFAFVILSSYYGYTELFPVKPDPQFIESAINKRITDLQQQADARRQDFNLTGKAKPLREELNQKIFAEYKTVKSYYRNEYFLNTGFENIHSRVNVERTLGLNMDNVSLANNYNLTAAQIFYHQDGQTANIREEHFLFYNTAAVEYTIRNKQVKDNYYQVTITYTNPLRVVQTTLIFPATSNDTRHHQVNIVALPPVEVLSFVSQGDDWVITKVK